ATPCQQIRLSGKDRGCTDRGQLDVSRRHRAMEDLLPSARADDDDGPPGVARGAVVFPGVATGKVGNAAQTIRAQVAAELPVVGQTSPRVLVRERAFARLVFGAN